MENGRPPRQRFLGQLHHPKGLGAGQPEGSRRGAVVNGNLDIREQLRSVLHLVDEKGQVVELQKQGGVLLGKPALLQVVQGNVIPVRGHQLPQHGGFAHLPGAGNEQTWVLLG